MNSSIESGSIVIVKFPFSNLESEKKRPALVLNRVVHTEKIQLITIAMITSKVEGPKFKGDVLLQKWQDSGLLHPSVLRLSKISTVDIGLINRVLGVLEKQDLIQIKKIFKEMFGYWLTKNRNIIKSAS